MSNFHNSGPEIFFYPWDYASATYLKLVAVKTAQFGSFAFVSASITNQTGSVTLTNDQVQALGNAIRMHLSTGSVNKTIGGVQVVTHDANSVDITVSGTTTNLDNDSAAGLADGALRYVVTKQPPQVHTDQNPLLGAS